MENKNFDKIKNNSIRKNALKINRNGKINSSLVVRGIACCVLVMGSISLLYVDAKKNNADNNINELQIKTNNIANFNLTADEKIDNMYKQMLVYAEKNKIDDLTCYYEQHYMELNSDELNEEIMYLYASNAYKKAHDSGLDNQTIVKELGAMYEAQEIPACIDDESLFSNLCNTLNPNNESLFMIYGPLSIITHNETCTKEHVVNRAGGLSHKGEEPDFGVSYTLSKKSAKF